MSCPNTNLEEWKLLVASRGEDVAYALWDLYDGNVPESESKSEIVKTGLKATNILQSPKADQFFNAVAKNKISGDFFWKKMQADLGIPKDQLEILKSFNTQDRGELISSLLANYSFAIEINISKETKKYQAPIDSDDVYTEIVQPTQYYSNLTVPGGTNYTENEIATPAITPSIKGHAQFATDKGIGWFRSDDKNALNKQSLVEADPDTLSPEEFEEARKDFALSRTSTKTRRILEVQSDLFQKGRDRKDLISYKPEGSKEYVAEHFGGWAVYNSEIGVVESGFTTKEAAEKWLTPKDNKNDFLQLLNQGSNWVTFFVKSIVQDSAKKGYEKVLFPSGNTASKVEGHTTLEEFKKQKEDRIKELEQQKIHNEKLFNVDKYEDIIQKDFSVKDEEGVLVDYMQREGKWQKQKTNKNNEFKVATPSSTDVFENYKKWAEKQIKRNLTIDNEITQLKQELERVEGPEGFGALKPIYNFYENTVKNVLNKQYGKENVKQITDEYGNTWNEINIVPEREQQSILLQTAEMPSSKASEETVAMMREAAEQMGIDIQDLLDYAKANPNVDVKNVNGLADLMKGAIAIAQGKEDVALVEEIVHLSTAMIEQTNPKLITELISKIDRFKIYKQVLEVYSKKKEYQLANGKPNIRKIKKEAVDKLISEVVIYQSEGSTEYPELMEEENRSMIKEWWNTILDYIRGMYKKSNIDIFQTAGTIVKSGKAGTVADIKTEGVYLQIDSSVKAKIDNFYNKVKDHAKDMVYNPEILDASGNVIQKRGYTFKGEPVATTITEKIKKNKKFPERTPEQKASDDAKKDWGSEGHRFLEKYFVTNLIDQDGYRKPVFGNSRIDSTLSLDLQKQLKNFAEELIASYPEGTRFLIEEMVVNTKEKGMIGSRVDFKAVYPFQKKDGTYDMKIDTLDWKFTTVDKTRYDDISRDKIKDWVPQMGQFVAIDYTYGANQSQMGKSRMIPFVVNYNYRIAGDKKSGLVPESIEIGKIDSLKETNLYLLPVPILSETTGNEQVDKLINSLQAQWDKLYSKPITFEGKDKRIADLSELSKAIRFLHLKLDFEPLVNVGKTFLNNAADILKDFKDIKFAELSDVELNKKLEDLIAYEEGAKKYADLDETFLSYYPRQELTPEGKKIVNDLTNIGRSTENMLKEIKNLQKQFVVEIALRENFTTEDSQLSVLDAEATISGIEKSFAEGSKLSSKLINLATNFIMVAKKVVDGKIRKQIKQFGELLVPLEQEAKAKGVKAFDMIATKSDKGLSLIKKINPEFWNKVNEAKENKNKQFFLNNLNLDEYNALAKTAMEQRISDASKRQYASDPETNERYKEYAIEAVKNALDITSDSFNGYNDRTFGYLFNKSFKEEKNYSKEYLEMSKSKAALDVWNFFTDLNKRAESMGYIGEYQDSFFPLMEATILEKFYQSSNVGAQTKDFFQDFYKIKVNEEQQFSKLDPETGKVKKIIPKFFTRTDKAVEQLSTDLNKVGSLWIKSLEEYESKKNLESILTTLHSVEKAKGSLIMENGKVVFENRIPKVNVSENKNADLLQVIIDDELYGLRENQSSLGNIAISAVSSKLGKTEEGVEKFEVGTKKVIATADTWVQALAVGLKPAIGIANWFGNQFLAFIQAGGFYNFWTDFEKNNVRVSTGQMSTIERGLLDLIHPLNEDVTEEERRSLAWKQGFTKYLSTWSFTDVMQITNSFPERKLQYANALSFIDNSIVIDGEIRNIRKYLKEQDRKTKYNLSVAERKSLESTFENRVNELKKAPNALKNIAKIENGEVIIPGVSDLNIAKFSLQVSEYGRTLNGQMSLTNKADYRRDTMFSSFMMFKNWIPKLVTARGMDIKKNVELDTWEYGRTRAFFKTVAFLGKSNITSMIDIINGTEKGLKILDDLLEAKKIEHYKKTGQELEITQEEFYDLMREQLVNQSKEFALLFGTLALVFAAAAAEPPEDATDAEKNAYKWYSKLINKISDEVSFYYNPISFESITKGSLLPSVGLLSKGLKIVQQLSLEGYGMATEDEEMMKKAHALKYTFNVVPGLSQLQNEVLPYLYPELAKEQGIRVTGESRRQ